MQTDRQWASVGCQIWVGAVHAHIIRCITGACKGPVTRCITKEKREKSACFGVGYRQTTVWTLIGQSAFELCMERNGRLNRVVVSTP